MNHDPNKILSHKNTLYLLDAQDFEPRHIFENGQTFRWEVEAEEYTFVAGPYLSKIKKLTGEEIADLAQETKQTLAKDSPIIRLQNAGDLADYQNFWRQYFVLDRDYSALKKDLAAKDTYLKEALEFAPGIRVLRQDFFEMVISFIISANNNIGRIKKSIAKLCELAGQPLGQLDGQIYYQFPTAQAIAALDEDRLTATGVGYRAPYLLKSAQMIAGGRIDLAAISQMPYPQAHAALLELPGVGPKVADCILLFGDGRDMAFPVDTWVIKVMNQYYLGEEKNSKKIKAYGLDYFGDQAGLAQQYLFYHAREQNIGRKKK